MAVESVLEVFTKHMPDKLKAKPELCDQINASYRFELSGDKGGTWVVDLTKPGGKIIENGEDAQCIVMMTEGDFLDVMNGNLTGQMAFMTGKLKVKGDMMLAMKLEKLLGN